MFEVILADSAKADIRRNVQWWSENRSPSEAERWYDAVMDKIRSLEHMPMRCPQARESKQLGIDVHHLLFGLSSSHLTIGLLRREISLANNPGRNNSKKTENFCTPKIPQNGRFRVGSVIQRKEGRKEGRI